MYNIGDIFYLDDEYTQRADFCNNNNLKIVEIEPDEKGRRFQIQSFILTKEEVLDFLRTRREEECFPIINRGVLWYNLLTDEQRLELGKWYKEWLDITDTYRNTYKRNSEFDIETIIPSKPSWLIN